MDDPLWHKYEHQQWHLWMAIITFDSNLLKTIRCWMQCCSHHFCSCWLHHELFIFMPPSFFYTAQRHRPKMLLMQKCKVDHIFLEEGALLNKGGEGGSPKIFTLAANWIFFLHLDFFCIFPIFVAGGISSWNVLLWCGWWREAMMRPWRFGH